MGGSSAQPDDLKGNRSEPQAILRKRRRELADLIKNYLLQLNKTLVHWPAYPWFYWKETLRLIDLIERKVKEYISEFPNDFVGLKRFIFNITIPFKEDVEKMGAIKELPNKIWNHFYNLVEACRYFDEPEIKEVKFNAEEERALIKKQEGNPSNDKSRLVRLIKTHISYIKKCLENWPFQPKHSQATILKFIDLIEQKTKEYIAQFGSGNFIFSVTVCFKAEVEKENILRPTPQMWDYYKNLVKVSGYFNEEKIKEEPQKNKEQVVAIKQAEEFYKLTKDFKNKLTEKQEKEYRAIRNKLTKEEKVKFLNEQAEEAKQLIQKFTDEILEKQQNGWDKLEGKIREEEIQKYRRDKMAYIKHIELNSSNKRLYKFMGKIWGVEEKHIVKSRKPRKVRKDLDYYREHHFHHHKGHNSKLK